MWGHGEEDVGRREGCHSCKELITGSAQAVRDRQDIGNMVEGDDGGGTENTAHLPDGVILRDLEGTCETFLVDAGKPQGGAIGECG